MCLAGSDGAFQRTPSDATLIHGSQLRLNCGTDDPPVEWRFKNSTGATVPLTAGGVLFPNYQSLFTIPTNYDLLASQAQTGTNETYCGQYNCTENNGDGDTSSAHVASK